MASQSVETALITKERSNVTFNVEEMTNLFDGGEENTKLRRKIVEIIQNDAVLGDMDLTNVSDEDRFIKGIRRTIRLSEMDIPGDTDMLAGYFVIKAMGKEMSLSIHKGAFIPTIQKLGTPEQVEKWVPLAEKNYIIGTYGQTELGHGTNLRALETTATYDPHTLEFVVNSPKLTSMKWWPGDLAKCANHVVVMAQLIVGEKNHGMHPFIVQIRDLDTHMPLSGVKVGFVGPKLGYESVNNGFLLLDNVRIPRENMLAKLSEVLPDGTYVKRGDQRIMYSSMMLLRVSLVLVEAIFPLQMACTIAARYSVVRRQGAWKPGDPEIPVLDYVTQQHKVLPAIATAYAFNFSSMNTVFIYNEVMSQVQNGDFSNLQDIHALSAGMKAFYTDCCLKNSEICRRACGGHGYLKSSGFGYFLMGQLASVTYEGENTVMYLQCARYLLKCAAMVMAGKKLGRVSAYLNDTPGGKCPAKTQKEMGQPGTLLRCFEQKANSMIKETAMRMQSLLQSGLQQHEAWNRVSVDLVRMAKAHLQRYVLSTFIDMVSTVTASGNNRRVLTELCSLYGLHLLSDNPSQLLKTGYLSPEQVAMAIEEETAVMSRLRKDAVGLVDAFDFSDKTLRSCIGAYDGNAYERLYENAKKASLNREEVHQETYQLLRPYLHRGRDILRGVSKL